mmetsp:Transcript_123541/g.349271  ORF Transcript_123541/g.349271 Transcript_123541/m.349271 type:complete len:272 (-) Transcript_123541:133-948(-)
MPDFPCIEVTRPSTSSEADLGPSAMRSTGSCSRKHLRVTFPPEVIGEGSDAGRRGNWGQQLPYGTKKVGSIRMCSMPQLCDPDSEIVIPSGLHNQRPRCEEYRPCRNDSPDDVYGEIVIPQAVITRQADLHEVGAVPKAKAQIPVAPFENRPRPEMAGLFSTCGVQQEAPLNASSSRVWEPGVPGLSSTFDQLCPTNDIVLNGPKKREVYWPVGTSAPTKLTGLQVEDPPILLAEAEKEESVKPTRMKADNPVPMFETEGARSNLCEWYRI